MKAYSEFNLDDVLSDTCCAPSCEAPAIQDDPPGFPICPAHYADVVRHFMSRVHSRGWAMSDWMGTPKLPPPPAPYAFPRPPGSQPKGRDSVVYFIRFGSLIKIGTTTNLPLRLQAIPHDEVIATIPGDRHVEREWHQRFSKIRHRGEWFRAEEQLLLAISQAA